MPNNWEAYRDWREMVESTKRRPQEELEYEPDDDKVDDLLELLRDYSE